MLLWSLPPNCQDLVQTVLSNVGHLCSKHWQLSGCIVSKHNRMYHQQAGWPVHHAQLPTGQQLAANNQQYEGDSTQYQTTVWLSLKTPTFNLEQWYEVWFAVRLATCTSCIVTQAATSAISNAQVSVPLCVHALYTSTLIHITIYTHYISINLHKTLRERKRCTAWELTSFAAPSSKGYT